MASSFFSAGDEATILRSLSTKELWISNYDTKRRLAVMRRRPEVYRALSQEERSNFVAHGLSFRAGHLEGALRKCNPLQS